MTVRQALLVAFFCACFYPITSGDGISLNYGFVLLPLGVVLVRGRLHYPGGRLALAMAVFTLIFFCACLYQVDLLDDSGRRLLSFVVFMTVFSYCFIKIDADMIAAFKAAVVAASVYLSLLSIYRFLYLGGVDIGYEAKDLVGSQQYGYIYVVAIWLVLLDARQKALFGVFRYVVLAVLTAGSLLTFARAAIVAVLVSGALFALSRGSRLLVGVSLKGVLQVVWAIGGLLTLGWILYRVFPLPFDFFGDRLFGLFSNTDLVEAHLADETTSEGTRILLVQKVLEFVTRNPLTGAGYLGIWILPNMPVNSAHNQYTDVLFRTGIVGFLFYAGIILAVLQHLWKRERPLFWGFIGMLTYGLFRETFKESQGGFLLAFLLAMAVQALRQQHGRALAGGGSLAVTPSKQTQSSLS